MPAALNTDDIGKTVEIVWDRLKIDDKEREHVAWNGAKHSNCKGKIANVEAKVMGQVTLDEATFQNPVRGFAQVLASLARNGCKAVCPFLCVRPKMCMG